MKTIAIPTIGDEFSTHFGGAEAFALFTVDETARSVVDRRLLTPPEHGRGVFPMWLKQQGADVVLASGIGPRAISILEQHGIEVVLGVDSGRPETLVRDYLSGTLHAGGEPCNDHGFHDCGHHDHGPAGRGRSHAADR